MCCLLSQCIESVSELITLFREMTDGDPLRRPRFAEVLERLIKIREATPEATMQESVLQGHTSAWAWHVREEK